MTRQNRTRPEPSGCRPRSLPPILLATALLVSACLSAPIELAGQGTVVDEGEFRIMIRGLDVGSESFVIRRSGTGAETRFTAQGRIVIEGDEGRVEMATTLGARGPTAQPNGYQRNVSGARKETVTFSLQRTRFVVRISSDAGEEMREIPVPEGGLLAEERVAHQFHFVVARFLEGESRLRVIRPESRSVVTIEIEEREPTTLQTRAGRIRVRRLRLAEGPREWEVWFDSLGRVLRLENAAEGFRAERTSPPS